MKSSLFVIKMQYILHVKWSIKFKHLLVLLMFSVISVISQQSGECLRFGKNFGTFKIHKLFR